MEEIRNLENIGWVTVIDEDGNTSFAWYIKPPKQKIRFRRRLVTDLPKLKRNWFQQLFDLFK